MVGFGCLLWVGVLQFLVFPELSGLVMRLYCSDAWVLCMCGTWGLLLYGFRLQCIWFACFGWRVTGCCWTLVWIEFCVCGLLIGSVGFIGFDLYMLWVLGLELVVIAWVVFGGSLLFVGGGLLWMCH